MTDWNREESREKRRRNLHAKKLHEQRGGEYRLKIQAPPPKGRVRKPLRPTDVLNLTEDELEEFE